jgi:hypothetical protein
MKNIRRPLLSLAVILWLAVTLQAFLEFHGYSSTPGTTAATPVRIPDALRAQSGNRTFQLILFAHPRCPCTRATLTELAILLEINHDPVSVEVRFIRPKGMPAGWEQTAHWRTAAAIPGVDVFGDEDGAVARRLGAETSGQVVLYDPNGHLLFSGGITRARGQDGESAGRRAILMLLSGKVTPADAPVFGCPLFAPGERCGKEEYPCRP